MVFKFSDKQESLLKVWKNDIRRRHGEYGLFEYTFKPYGMGTAVIVYSVLTDSKLDISFVEDW